MSLLIGLAVLAAAAADPAPFAWPPPAAGARPWTRWWWLGSAVDEANLTRRLEEFQRAGFGGVEICPIYGTKGHEHQFVDFLSPRWVELLAHTTREAKRLGLGVDLTTGTGWPFGGPWVSAADASAKLVLQKQPTGYTAVQVSPVMKVKRAAPGGVGNVLDPYSVAKLDRYLAHFDAALKGFAAPMPRGHFHDSFEYYQATWTDDFFDQFRARRGYDLRDHLPALAGDGPPDTVARVKCDYRERWRG